MYNKKFYSQQFINAVVALKSKVVSDKIKTAALYNFDKSLADKPWTDQCKYKFELMSDANLFDYDYVHYYNPEIMSPLPWTYNGPFGDMFCSGFDFNNTYDLFFSENGFNGDDELINKYHNITKINSILGPRGSHSDLIDYICNYLHDNNLHDSDYKYDKDLYDNIKNIIEQNFPDANKISFNRITDKFMCENIDLVADIIKYIYDEYYYIAEQWDDLMSEYDAFGCYEYIGCINDYDHDEYIKKLTSKFHAAVALNDYVEKYNNYFSKKAAIA